MTVDSDNPGAVYNADHTSEINLVGRVVFNTWRILRYRGVFRWGGGRIYGERYMGVFHKGGRFKAVFRREVWVKVQGGVLCVLESKG